MLRTTLLHPTILRALASSGHGSLILIADGNYPVATASPPTAERVYLNLRPGVLTVTAVLDTLLSAMHVEAAHVMQPADGGTPPVFADFGRLLPDLALQRLEREAFYDQARHPNLSLAIVTGDQRLYANILLTMGVVAPE
jgi:L-fucose mutarotase